MLSIGFRETEGGSLVFPLNANLSELQARQLEIEVGLDMLKSRLDVLKSMQPTEESKKLLGKESVDLQVTAKRAQEADNTARKVSSSSAELQQKSNMAESVYSEKVKRQKAEAMVIQQQKLLSELQGQIVDLRENEQLNMQLQFSRSVNAIDITTNEAAAQEINSSIKYNNKNSKPPTVTQQSQSRDSRVASAKKLIPINDEPFTELNADAAMGDARLIVKSQENFKKGMLVLIGSGSSLECHRVIGFGSLLIDNPLIYCHSAGSPVRGYKPNSRNIRIIERKLITEFTKSLILDELLNHCVQVVENANNLKQLNSSYQHRPVVQHSYFVEALPSLDVGIVQCNSLVFSAATTAIIAPLEKSITSVTIRFTTVEAVALFEMCAANFGISNSSVVSFIHKDWLLQYLHHEYSLNGIFQAILDSKIHFAASSISDLLNTFADKEGKISWNSFISLLTGMESNRTSSPAEVTGSSTIDGMSLSLLQRVFEFSDLDEDGALAESEVIHLFSELDGVTPDECFTDIAERVLGKHVETRKIVFSSFLSIREKYCLFKGTMTGGIRLHGKLLISEISRHYEKVMAGPPGRELQFRLPDIIHLVPPTFASQQYLPTNQRVYDILMEDFHLRTVYTATDVFDKSSDLLRRFVSRESMKSTADLNIAQLCLDNTKNLLIAFTKEGVARIFDVLSGSQVFEERLIWCEPLPNKAVEGFEKFYSWRRESGLDYSDKSPEMRLNVIEKKRVSTLLARLGSDLSVAVGSSQQVIVDDETGMIVVDSTIASGSICFYEPIALRRIYRIRSPIKVPADIDNMITSIINGSQGVPDVSNLQNRSLMGLMVSFDILSQRSLLLCLLYGSKNIKIVSMLTGELIVDVSGHSDVISCIISERRNFTLFTGSVDSSIRVWRLDDILPYNSTSTISSQLISTDHSLQASENRISQSSVVPRNTSHMSRTLFTQLCSCLKVRPTWMQAKIIGLYDGNVALSKGVSDQSHFGVEVVLSNAAVQMVSNRISLRDAAEIITSPDGPRWNRQPAVVAVGKTVAIYSINLDILAIEVGRALHHSINHSINFNQLVNGLTNIMSGSHSNPIEEGLIHKRSQELGGEIEFLLQTMGYSDRDSIDLSIFIRQLHRLQEKPFTYCDRYLRGHRTTVTSIVLASSSKLLISMDKRFALLNNFFLSEF